MSHNATTPTLLNTVKRNRKNVWISTGKLAKLFSKNGFLTPQPVCARGLSSKGAQEQINYRIGADTAPW